MRSFEFITEQTLDEMPLPADWDPAQYQQGTSFKQRLAYALERAKKLGAGSSRVAMTIEYQGRPTVLKIAKNNKGLAQNNVEADILGDGYASQLGILIPLIDYDEQNREPMWIHTEMAQKVSEKQLANMMGVDDLNDIVQMGKAIAGKSKILKHQDIVNYMRTTGKTEEQIETATEYGNILADLANSFDIELNDLIRKANWGIYNGKPVIIDAGANSNVISQYYKSESIKQGVAEGSNNESLNHLVSEFLKSISPKELRYYTIRDNCGPAALHMKDWAEGKEIDLTRHQGYFVADNVVYDKADFTKEMKREFIKQGLDFNDPTARKQFIESNPKYSEEWKKIPHYWLQDKQGNIYDPTGYIQFVKTGLSSDLDKSRYKPIRQGVAEDSSNNIPTVGINVRSDGDIDYASLIVDGKKKYESRKTNSLRPYIGKTVGIVRTGNGPAVAIGQVTIGEPIIVDLEKFNKLRNQHLVPRGSKFDIDSDGTKYLYPMINPVRWDNEKPIKNKGIVSRKIQEQLDEYNVRKTKKFIQRAHDQEQGQMYGNMPYSSHPKQVANFGKKFFGTKFGPEAVKVALLHDILEDTPYTIDQLAKKGFSKEVIQAVQLLTKNKALSYADNIRNIINSGNSLAMMVKYSDNYMNYTGDKSHWTPERAAHSQKKYLASLNMLGDVLGIKKHIGDEVLDEYKVDNKNGLGSVPYNQDVDYFGMKVMMKPSTFLKLALPLNKPVSVDHIAQHLKNGGSLGAPFLDVTIPPEWEQGDRSEPARVSGHEGRNRMLAIQQVEGDDPVEVHIFPKGGMRARHLTPEIVSKLRDGMMNQERNKFISGALFS